MAIQNDFITILENNFNNLSTYELNALKDAFQNFYLNKEYDSIIKIEIEFE